MKKRWTVRTAVLGMVVALAVGLAARPARSGCATQGQFALGLGQVLSLVGAEASEAQACAPLVLKGIEPAGGWALGTCADASFLEQIEADLQAAIAAGGIHVQFADALQRVQAGIAGVAAAAAAAGAGGEGDSAPQAGKTRNPNISPHTGP